MSRRKPPPHVVKLVWRITNEAPMGEYVDPLAQRNASGTKQGAESHSVGWIDSSFDLLHGADVTLDPDGIPQDLLDELFGNDDWPCT